MKILSTNKKFSVRIALYFNRLLLIHATYTERDDFLNITVIHGSMRKGNTYHLTQAVIAELRAYQDVTVTEFDVRALDLPFCTSCHQCFTKGENACPHHEKMRALTSSIESCDALMMSGVVYSMHLNAAMKNLIDHLSYYFHRPRLFGKKGMVITTTAGAGEKTVSKYLQSVMGIWGVHPVTNLQCKIQSEKFSLTQKQTKILKDSVRDFHFSLLHNTKKSPTFHSIAIYNAFRGMSAVPKPISDFDKKYWRSTGMADKVYPQKIGFLQALYGNIVFHILKTVMAKK